MSSKKREFRFINTKTVGDITDLTVWAVLCYEPKFYVTLQLWCWIKRFTAIFINLHNIRLVSPRMGAGSSARLERSTDNRKVGSSNPPRPTIQTSIKPVILACFLLKCNFFFNFLERRTRLYKNL